MSRNPPAFRAVTVPLSPALGESATPIGTSFEFARESVAETGLTSAGRDEVDEPDVGSGADDLGERGLDPVFAGGSGTGQFLVSRGENGHLRLS
jgi:hypothetical protein